MQMDHAPSYRVHADIKHIKRTPHTILSRLIESDENKISIETVPACNSSSNCELRQYIQQQLTLYV
jgi:hypothetical protein